MAEHRKLSVSDDAIYMILEQPITMEVLWIGRTEVVFCRESHANQQEATSITATQSTCQTHTMDDSCSQPVQPLTHIWLQQPHIFFPPSPSDALIIPTCNLRSAPFWNSTQGTVVVPYGRFGTTYRYHIQGGARRTRRNLLGYPRTAQMNRGLVVCVAYWTAFRGFNLKPLAKNSTFAQKATGQRIALILNLILTSNVNYTYKLLTYSLFVLTCLLN